MRPRETAVALAATLVLGVGTSSAVVLRLLDARPGGGATAVPDDVALVPAPAVVGEAAPGPELVPDGVRLSGRARSVAVDGVLQTDGDVVWEAVAGFSAPATTVRTADGRDLGPGTVTASGRVALRSAGGTRVSSSAGLRVRADAVVVPGGDGTFPVEASVDGEALQLRGALQFVPEGTEAARPVPGGTAALRTSRVTVSGRVLRWPSPGSLTARGPGLVSVDAPGAVAVLPGGRRLGARYLGVAADELDVTLRRDGRAVVLGGRALAATQVYTDGSPRLRTTAAVRVLDPFVTVDRTDGDDDRFDWAPENTGGADMLITRVRPLNREAAWVQLRLARGPAVFGGADRPGVGGDTTGLGRGDLSCFFCTGAKSIRSLLPPGDADRRGITVAPPADVPPGRYVARLRVEGNFPPVDVSVPVRLVR